MKPRARDARLMRFCHRGVLQFIVTKPIMAVINVIMLATGLYFNPIYQTLEIIVYNISYGWALYCLFVFYLATKPVIKHFKPIAKFSTVKAIIFATYYQSMILKLTLSTPEKAIRWNDFLLCAEMVVFSLLLMMAFPVREFIGGIPDRRVLQNVKEVFAVRELFQDMYHNFNPIYRDYALQRSQTEAPPTVQIHAYFDMNPVAMEMTERYRGRSKRFAFNSLLRGTRPVRAGLRRQYGNPEDDLYHFNSNNNSSNTLNTLHDNAGFEDHRLNSTGDTESSLICDSRRSSFDSAEGNSGGQSGDLEENNAKSMLHHIGRLTLAKTSRVPTSGLSSSAKATHLQHRVTAESMDQIPLTASAEAQIASSKNYGSIFSTAEEVPAMWLNNGHTGGDVAEQRGGCDLACTPHTPSDLKVVTKSGGLSALTSDLGPILVSPSSISDSVLLMAANNGGQSLPSRVGAVGSPPRIVDSRGGGGGGGGVCSPVGPLLRQPSATEWSDFV
eukprot:gene21901-27978_t